MSDDITNEDINHISDLSRLGIQDDQIETLRSEFSEILEKFSNLEEVDIDEIENKDNQRNIVRQDEKEECIDIRQFKEDQGRDKEERRFEN